MLSSLTAVASYEDAVLAHYELSDVGEDVVVCGIAGANRAPGEKEYFDFFRFEGLLWCYAPAGGTWIYGPAPAEWPPSDQQVLKWIKEADASFHRVSIYRDVPASVVNQADLPHGCVVVCLAQISQLLIKSGTPDEVGLVLFSYDSQRNPAEGIGPLVVGHSILVYRYQDKWFCFDPQRQDALMPLTQVTVGAPLDSTLKTLAERPNCRLEHARLLRISRRTLDGLDATLTWRLLASRPK